MLKKFPIKFTFSVVFTILRRLIDSSPPPLRGKGNKHPLRSKVNCPFMLKCPSMCTNNLLCLSSAEPGKHLTSLKKKFK